MALTGPSFSLEGKYYTTYRLLPVTSISVNEKLSGKRRRTYWLEVSMKNSSMSALLAAKEETRPKFTCLLSNM